MSTAIIRALAKLDRGEKLTQADIDDVAAEMPDAIAGLREIVEKMTAWIAEVLPVWVDTLVSLVPQLAAYNKALTSCPDQRVVQLAMYGKKARTRKKNLRRAYKIIEREARK